MQCVQNDAMYNVSKFTTSPWSHPPMHKVPALGRRCNFFRGVVSGDQARPSDRRNLNTRVVSTSRSPFSQGTITPRTTMPRTKIDASHLSPPGCRRPGLPYPLTPGSTTGRGKGTHHKRPMDPTSRLRIENLTPLSGGYNSGYKKRTDASIGQGGPRSPQQAGSPALPTQDQKFLQHPVCGTKEGRRLATCDQPEATQLVPSADTSLQDGNNPELEGCSLSGRLHGETGPEGRLLDGARPPRRPQIYVEGQSIRIHYTPIRSGTSPPFSSPSY